MKRSKVVLKIILLLLFNTKNLFDVETFNCNEFRERKIPSDIKLPLNKYFWIFETASRYKKRPLNLKLNPVLKTVMLFSYLARGIGVKQRILIMYTKGFNHKTFVNSGNYLNSCYMTLKVK